MEIRETKKLLREQIKISEDLKRGFASMVIMAPQILDEEDLMELREEVDTLASNFEVMASFLYTWGRISATSDKFIPKLRAEK